MYCKCGFGGPGSMWNASNIGADLDDINIRCPKCDIPALGFQPEDFDLGKTMNDFKKAVDNRQAYELRDWFAGMAMQGMLSRDLVHDRTSNYSARWANVATDNDHGLPKRAYAIADTMLEAREEPDATNT